MKQVVFIYFENSKIRLKITLMYL